MADPYVAPNATPADASVRPMAWWVLAIALVPAVLATLFVTLVVPQFTEMFRNFGAELPILTGQLVRWYGAVWLWPLVVVGVFVQLRRHRLGVVMLSLVSVVGSGLLVASAMAVLYLPMMKLAATI